MRESQLRRIIRQEIREISVPDLKRQRRATNKPSVDPLVSRSSERQNSVNIQKEKKKINNSIANVLSDISDLINKKIDGKTLNQINDLIQKHSEDTDTDEEELYQAFFEELYVEVSQRNASDLVDLNLEYSEVYNSPSIYAQPFYTQVNDVVLDILGTALNDLPGIPLIYLDLSEGNLTYGTKLSTSYVYDWYKVIGDSLDTTDPAKIVSSGLEFQEELYNFMNDLSEIVVVLNFYLKRMVRQYK